MVMFVLASERTQVKSGALTAYPGHLKALKREQAGFVAMTSQVLVVLLKILVSLYGSSVPPSSITPSPVHALFAVPMHKQY